MNRGHKRLTSGVGAEASKKLEAYVPLAIHGAGMDLEDLCAAIKIRQAELNLPIQPSRTQQRRVQRIRPVGGHEHLDIAPRIKPIKLVHDLKHGALDLIVAADTIVEASAANGVDLVEEDDARLLRSGHLEELADHASTFTDVLLNQLAADHSDEAGVGAVGDCSGEKGFAGARRAVAEDSLGRIDAELDELFWVQHGKLDDFAHLLDLFLAATNVVVCYVRFFFNCHHCNAWIDFGWQRNLNLVLVPVKSVMKNRIRIITI